MYRLFFILSGLSLLSCHGQGPASNTVTADTTAIAVATNADTTVQDYDSTIPVTKQVIISRDTVEVKQSASSSSRTMEKTSYGGEYEVIRVEGGWAAVWSKQRYPYRGLYNGAERLIIAARKVYIPSKALGEYRDLRLFDEDIQIVTMARDQQNTDYVYYEGGKRWTKDLDFKLISRAEYEHKKSEKFDYLVQDTLTYPKVDSRLVLKATAKEVIFQDSPSDAEESRAEYFYIGHIPSLHQFIVQGNYWESTDYKLINMTTGETAAEMTDFPRLSPDGRHIVSLYSNPYESSEDIEIYRIATDGNIALQTALSFRHWMAGDGPDDIFFARDSMLYMPVFFNLIYWDQSGNFNKPNQYMRIKIR